MTCFLDDASSLPVYTVSRDECVVVGGTGWCYPPTPLMESHSLKPLHRPPLTKLSMKCAIVQVRASTDVTARVWTCRDGATLAGTTPTMFRHLPWMPSSKTKALNLIGTVRLVFSSLLFHVLVKPLQFCFHSFFFFKIMVSHPCYVTVVRTQQLMPCWS